MKRKDLTWKPAPGPDLSISFPGHGTFTDPKDGMVHGVERDGKIYLSRAWYAKLQLLCATEGKGPATKAEATPFGGIEVVPCDFLPFKQPTKATHELVGDQPR